MTYDFQRVISELKLIRPDLKEMLLGKTVCFYYQIVGPAHTFDFVVLPRTQDLLVIKARSSFARNLATDIVTFCEQSHAVATGLTVFDGFRSSGFSFNCIAFAAPTISRSFKGESEYLTSYATWVFPSHHCEFRSDREGKDFEFLIGKGGRIDILNWNREPTPQSKIRLLTDWPGGMLAKQKKLGIVQWESLIHIATNIPPPVEVVVANIEDDEIHIVSTPSGFNCSGAISGKHLSTKELSVTLKSFLLCQDDQT